MFRDCNFSCPSDIEPSSQLIKLKYQLEERTNKINELRIIIKQNEKKYKQKLK